MSNQRQPVAWHGLRRHTPARIALARTGGSVTTRDLLAFNHDHALARDAVQATLNVDRLTTDLRALDAKTRVLASAVHDRATFLRRPDLGRQLADESRRRLATHSAGECDLVIIISDGLSSQAAHDQAPVLLRTMLPLLARDGWKLAPLCLIPYARVGILDEVGATLRARLALILLGERPGLGTPDSLGAYFEFGPAPGRTNADRNCVSNIRPGGLIPDEAAGRIVALLRQSRRLGLSGVRLKEEPAD